MEFVAIVSDMDNQSLSEIIEIAAKYNYKVITNNSSYDSEIKNGIEFFMERVKATTLAQIILPYKGKLKSTTSSLISEELQNLFIYKKPSDFLNFIYDLNGLSFKWNKFYFVFASEWENKSERVRFIKGSFDDIIEYFNKHNGYHLYLYSLDVFSYYPEFWCPLIFEIERKQF
jgi:hypothetical protein